MKIKKKLRYLTDEEYIIWFDQNCGKNGNTCPGCLFKSVYCCKVTGMSWINNKFLYSDKFLDQEIEIVVELTAEEKVLLLILDKKWKYIARDRDGSLSIHTEKPYKSNEYNAWYSDLPQECTAFIPFKDLFSFIQWDNEELYSIEYLLAEAEWHGE